MTQEELYQANQDFNRYNMLMHSREELNKEEYEFCKAWDGVEAASCLSKVQEDLWINLKVFTE